MNQFKFKIISKDPNTSARVSELSTPHGKINLPTFMPVGTKATVKTLSPEELKDLNANIILANTYHLYLRPGSDTIKKLGGLHKWMNWRNPILTDSGGFQVFSLAQQKRFGKNGEKKLVKILEDGVEFRSHIDGSKHFFTPEKVMKIQSDLGADIIMAFDECAPGDSTYAYAKKAMNRTHRWAERCKKEHIKLQKSKKIKQALFPIVQGGIYDDLRIESTKFMKKLNLPGIAIGGLSVGETKKQMYHTLDIIKDYLPEDKPRYLMGVGSPEDLLEGISRGIDMFDCVMATRNARHGSFWTKDGRFQLRNKEFKEKKEPLMKGCKCYTCKNYSTSYVRHLYMEKETFGLRLITIHNINFLLDLMNKSRMHIKKGTFNAFKNKFLKHYLKKS
ncbi:tRNA guanosine(34) transglycosylase Tgt [bacterium]|nr:tRNA guanosine(34) transglycosylase Tgt [bacterium]